MSEQSREQRIAQILSHCSDLLASPAFAWFLESAVKPGLDVTEARLRALGTSPAEREIAAHVAHALREVLEFAENQKQHYIRAQSAGD